MSHPERALRRSGQKKQQALTGFVRRRAEYHGRVLIYLPAQLLEDDVMAAELSFEHFRYFNLDVGEDISREVHPTGI